MARKRFGQHFLHEQGVIQRILDLVNATPDDAVLEIGPGQGALTWPLLRAAGRLTVIEIDRDLVARLRNQAPAELQIIETDALKADYAAISEHAGQALRLVGNLPYNISSPLLFALLAYPDAIHDMHFMLQKEVVDRIVADPGSKTYGRLSVAVAVRAAATRLFDIGPGAFTPPPKVMSSIVRMEPRTADFPIDNWTVFDQLVASAFSKRRKTLRNALSDWLTANDIEAVGIDPTLRPERITPAQFAQLGNWAAKKRGLKQTPS